MQLTDVSKTAIVALRSHVLESEEPNPLIRDPMARLLLGRLEPIALKKERAVLFGRKLSPVLTNHIALRARKYDAIANDFIAEHPACTVVNLGCGFDTRYWRIEHGKCEYLELDLPEIIELKKAALKDRLEYGLIGASVLDHAWMDRVNPGAKKKVLLLAEGLFMYLPKPEVIALFRAFSKKFHGSRIVFEVVTEKYTRGFWKQIILLKMLLELGFDSGSAYRFGVREAREIESYGDGLKVIREWSWVEDPDVRPKILRRLGLARTQWTVTAGIHPDR